MRHVSLHLAIDTPLHTPPHTRLLKHMSLYNGTRTRSDGPQLLVTLAVTKIFRNYNDDFNSTLSTTKQPYLKLSVYYWIFPIDSRKRVIQYFDWDISVGLGCYMKQIIQVQQLQTTSCNSMIHLLTVYLETNDTLYWYT